MKNKLFILLFTLCIIMSGCTGTASSSRAASPDNVTSERAEQFIKNGWEFTIGHSKARVIENLGKPLDIVVTPIEHHAALSPRVQNDMPPDESIDLAYDGLRVGIYRAVHENEELLQHVSITNSTYKVKWALGIGCAKSAVRVVLGKPTETDENADVYVTPHTTSSYVQFTYKNDIVKKIEWWYFLD